MNNWKQNSGYSAEDIMAMQKDAIARVKEMQRRADESLHRPPRQPAAQPAEPSQPSPEAPAHRSGERPAFPEPNRQDISPSGGHTQQPFPSPGGSSQGQQNSQGQQSGQGQQSAMGGIFSMVDNLLTASPPKGKLQGVLNALNVDNERLLVLILLVLLYNDGADYTVLFALLYLLI